VDLAGPRDRLEQGGTQRRIEGVDRRRDLLYGHPQGVHAYAVETLRRIYDRPGTMLADRLDNRAHQLHGGGDVEGGTGQQAARVGSGAAQVDPGQHTWKSKRLSRSGHAPPNG
jgi:hypothetical protein